MHLIYRRRLLLLMFRVVVSAQSLRSPAFSNRFCTSWRLYFYFRELQDSFGSGSWWQSNSSPPLYDWDIQHVLGPQRNTLNWAMNTRILFPLETDRFFYEIDYVFKNALRALFLFRPGPKGKKFIRDFFLRWVKFRIS